MQEFKYVKNMWYPIAFSHEIVSGKLYSRKLLNMPYVIWRDQASHEVVGFDDRCCHKRFPMSDGKLMDDGTIRCAYHGLRYASNGNCVEIPSQPGKPIPEAARLRSLPVREKDGVIWVWTGARGVEPTLSAPPTPEIADTDNDVCYSNSAINVDANYILLIENLLDTTHFYPLHEGNIGDKKNSEIEVSYDEGTADYTPGYIKTIRNVKNYRLPPFFEQWFGYQTVDRLHTHCMESPGLTRVVFRVAPPGELGMESERGYTLLHLHYPIDEGHLAWRWCVAVKKAVSAARSLNVAALMAEYLPTVIAQDEWVLPKQQRMYELPDDGYSEIFIKTDRAVRNARQLLLRLQREETADLI